MKAGALEHVKTVHEEARLPFEAAWKKFCRVMLLAGGEGSLVECCDVDSLLQEVLRNVDGLGR